MSLESSIITPRRGRPKGTGIDDSARLARIMAIMDRQPGLSASWVIREMLRISDPADIRRLRDKLPDRYVGRPAQR